MNIVYAGKTIIVTGAGAGIGRCSAGLFTKLGGQVVAVDIDPATLNATVDAITAEDGAAVAVQANITQASEVDKSIDTALSEYGKIAVLFNNAGGSFPTPM